MKHLDLVAFILLIIGGLNWGIVGVADFNVIGWIFQAVPVISKIIYIFVGLAALWKLYRFKEIYHHLCHCGIKHEEVKKE